MSACVSRLCVSGSPSHWPRWAHSCERPLWSSSSVVSPDSPSVEVDGKEEEDGKDEENSKRKERGGGIS